VAGFFSFGMAFSAQLEWIVAQRLEPQSSYTRNKTWLPRKVRFSSADKRPSRKWINDLTR
jgi:hypothetical protein